MFYRCLAWYFSSFVLSFIIIKAFGVIIFNIGSDIRKSRGRGIIGPLKSYVRTYDFQYYLNILGNLFLVGSFYQKVFNSSNLNDIPVLSDGFGLILLMLATACANYFAAFGMYGAIKGNPDFGVNSIIETKLKLYSICNSFNIFYRTFAVHYMWLCLSLAYLSNSLDAFIVKSSILKLI